MPIIPALNRLRHEDCEFKASLHNVNCLKKERQRDLEGETEPSPPLKEMATLKSAEVPYGAQPSWGGPLRGQISPQGPVCCPGVPCSHTAHKELLVSEISFSLRAQDPQHPLLGPIPTLQKSGRY